MLIIYPNPNNGSFKIESAINNAELILVNCFGQKVHQQKIESGLNLIVMDGIAAGLYSYVLLQNGQQISLGKLVLE